MVRQPTTHSHTHAPAGTSLMSHAARPSRAAQVLLLSVACPWCSASVRFVWNGWWPQASTRRVWWNLCVRPVDPLLCTGYITCHLAGERCVRLQAFALNHALTELCCLADVNTSHAKLGDEGSKTLPKTPTGVKWSAGMSYEVTWSIEAKCVACETCLVA